MADTLSATHSLQRPMTRLALAFTAAGLLAACAAEPPAEAPAGPAPAAVRTLPGPGGVATIPFTSVRVWFNDETDVGQSSLALEGPDGSISLVGVHSMGEGDLMAAVSGATYPGEYTLTWTAVSADGETATGDVPFSVASAEPAASDEPAGDGAQAPGDRD